jgi:hypothetical protein
MLHALPQLVECFVGLHKGCNDPPHHLLGAIDDPTRRYQSHALNGRIEISDNLRPLGLMIPCFCQAFGRFDDELGIELLALSGMMYAPLAPEQFPCVTQEAAKVDTPPISEPTNPAVAERTAVSISISSTGFS